MSNDLLAKVRDLNSQSSHADVRRHISNLLESELGWNLEGEVSTEEGSIDSVPLTTTREDKVPIFVIEYKSGESEEIKKLENKQGGQQGEIAIEQLERYVTHEKICNFGILCDASRLVLYERVEDKLREEPILQLRFQDEVEKLSSGLQELKSLLPLYEGIIGNLEISDIEEFTNVLKDSIQWIIEPIEKLYNEIQPSEYSLFKELFPSGITKEEFVEKTASAIVSKVLLLRALENQNDQFGVVLNPDVVKSFYKSEFGYILTFISAYELAALKFPAVFKSDIDVFDWWEPRHLESRTRLNVRDYHIQLNNRLAQVLERLYRYKINIKRDLLGLTYQKLRRKGETSILGAYFTPPVLADATLEAVEIMIGDLNLSNYGLYDLYNNPEFKVLDFTCGSGTFLISYANKAIEYTERRSADAANQIIRKLYGLDIDPLAVLMAREQIYGALSGYLDNPPPPNVFWTDTLELTAASSLGDQEYSASLGFEGLGPSAPINEVKQDIAQARDTVKENSFDLIIGNPPWGRRSEMIRHLTESGTESEEARSRVDNLVPPEWERYFSHRDDNFLTPFFIAADRLLKDGGIMALVIDARFQATDWGEPVVEVLEDFEEVRVLDVSLSKQAEFPESVSYPAIVLGVK